MRTTISPSLLAVLLLGACGGGGPEHWKDQPLETIQGSFEGHAYSIELPKGMKKSDITKAWDDYNYHAKHGDEDYVFAPSLSVGWTSKKHTVDEEIAREKDPVVVRKEQLSDGFIVVLEGTAMKKKKSYTVDLERYVGDGALTCHARVWEMAKGEDVKALVPRVEKMCLSLTAK